MELVSAAIAVTDAHDQQLGAFISRYTDQALAAAVAADEALAAGIDRGPLHGIPLGIKDLISTADGPTTAQSLVLDTEWGQRQGDAVAVARLRRAGAIVLGKLSAMEFGIGTPDIARPFPVPRNPWHLEHWAGGSSSGSGSAVASGMVLGALGTDTAGSIRIPAAYCGVTGLMPTYGRVPKSGCVPLAYSLDHVGPLTRSARDAALLLGVLAGHDASDPSSVERTVPDYLAALTGNLSGLRIGVQRLDQYAGDLEDRAVPGRFADAIAVLVAAGAVVVDIDLPFYRELTNAAFLILASEAVAYHGPDLRTRWNDYAPGTRRMLSTGFTLSAADYVQAQRARRVGQRALAQVFADVDLIVTPTASVVAARIDQLDTRRDSARGASHTAYWDCTGNPVVSVPMGFGLEGLPLGLQIAARPFDEETLLRAADAFQRQTDWHLQLPARYE
jgi:aspartyl-tRNA(Asn)/glutamyl-tRNA(Gln) amidotransferase subunit A